MALPYKHLTTTRKHSALCDKCGVFKLNYDPTVDSGFIAGGGGMMEARYFSFKYSCRVDKGRKWKPSQMKSQGSVSETEEEEAVEDGVTRNPISLEMLRWEGRRW